MGYLYFCGWVVRVLHLLWAIDSDIIIVNIISHSTGCLLTFLVSFELQIFESLSKYNLIFSFVACAFALSSNDPLLKPRLWRCMFYTKGFMLLSLILGSLIHLKLMVWGRDSTYLHVYVQLFNHHLMKSLSFPPLTDFNIFVENQLTTDVCVYFCTFYSFLLFSMCLSLR